MVPRSCLLGRFSPSQKACAAAASQTRILLPLPQIPRALRMEIADSSRAVFQNFWRYVLDAASVQCSNCPTERAFLP